jgi:hypothetical protein
MPKAVKPCLVGERFGRLVVTPNSQLIDGRFYHIARCDCGGSTKVKPSDLRGGRYVSCGCERREKLDKGLHRTHGHWDGRKPSSEWNAWHHMMSRCYDLDNPRYIDWGGRGIKVCKRWRESFEAFLEDMGPKPKPELVLDRIDNDGHYEPTNCRWATKSQSQKNRRPFVVGEPWADRMDRLSS